MSEPQDHRPKPPPAIATALNGHADLLARCQKLHQQPAPHGGYLSSEQMQSETAKTEKDVQACVVRGYRVKPLQR